jgi:glycosyltransferase involved in cell wall biosynthesis
MSEDAGVGARLLLVIVPALDEVATIGGTIDGIRRALADSRDVTVRIVVIDDGSTDGTGEVAARSGADRVIRHPTNLGLGAAVRTGLKAARDEGADVVVKIDADGQHDPADIMPLIRPILDDEADIVYGDRFARIEYRMPLVRRLGNRVFTGIMRTLTRWPLRDSQPGILAGSAEYLARFQVPGDYNYTQQILLDAYHRRLRFVHVPVAFRERTTGRSFVSFRYPARVLKQILLLLVLLDPLRVFVPLGLGFMAIGAAILVNDVYAFLMLGADRIVEQRFGVLGFGLFGLQTVFFGILGHLIIASRRD